MRVKIAIIEGHTVAQAYDEQLSILSFHAQVAMMSREAAVLDEFFSYVHVTFTGPEREAARSFENQVTAFLPPQFATLMELAAVVDLSEEAPRDVVSASELLQNLDILHKEWHDYLVFYEARIKVPQLDRHGLRSQIILEDDQVQMRRLRKVIDEHLHHLQSIRLSSSTTLLYGHPETEVLARLIKAFTFTAGSRADLTRAREMADLLTLQIEITRKLLQKTECLLTE